MTTPTPTCSTCGHHRAVAGFPARRECRANAPAFARESNDRTFGPHPVFLACWPLTLLSDGCGQHREIEATVIPPGGITPPPVQVIVAQTAPSKAKPKP